MFPHLTPKRIALYCFTLAVGLALVLPTPVTHTTRDNPVILGRYSVGLAVLILGVLVGVVGFLTLSLLTLVKPNLLTPLEKFVHAFWKRPLASRVLVALLLTLYAIALAGQDAFFRNYTVRYQRGLLLGLSIIVFALSIGLLTPWLAKYQPPPCMLASRRIRLAIIGIGSLLLCGILFGNILNLQWQPVDDGIIMHYLGSDGRVGLEEVPTLIASSEIGRAFVKGRYRPSFWTLRILESAVWGNNPTLYYVGRFAMLVLAVALFWWLVAEWLGLLVSGLFVLLSFTYVFWYDVWGRLGAAETYAVPALAVYLVTLVWLWRWYDHRLQLKPWQKAVLWLVNLGSGLVLIGAKENFLLALIPALGLLAFIVYRQRLDATSVAVTGVLLAVGLFIASSVGVALSTTGVDIYQNSVDAGGRSGILAGALVKILLNPLMLASAVFVASVMALGGWYVHTRGSAAMRRQFRAATARFLLIIAACALAYMAQIVYYNGDWPSDNRYDFPGRLVEPFLGLVLGLWLLDLVKIFSSSRWVVNTAYAALVFVLFALVLYRGFAPLESNLARSVAWSRRFTGNLNEIVERARPFANHALIFDAHNYWDHEPIVTTAIFLRGMGVPNLFYVRYQERETAPHSPIENKMGEWLANMSNNGYVWNGQQMFLPLTQADPQNCLSIGFSGPTTDSCAFLLKVYP